MLLRFPFFGILALSLELKEDKSLPTIATDGRSLFYNADFVASLSKNDSLWILTHEALHCALKHLWRKNGRDHVRWNHACDYAIHSLMKQFAEETGTNMTMPEDALYNPVYDDKSAEEIYEMLPPNPVGNMLDSHDPWNGTQSDPTLSSEWEERLVAAVKTIENKGYGKLPGYLKRYIGKIIRPQKDWRSLLHEFVQPEIEDYSFAPPDRRFSDFDFFLPDFNDTVDTIKDIDFFIDTSGSIEDDELAACFSEIVGAVGQFNNRLSGRLGFFDTKVYGLHPFESVDNILKIKPQGRGGTSFFAPFEYLNKNKKNSNTAGIVILTDGQAKFPEEPIANGIPVLWIITDDKTKPPWGMSAVLEVRQ